MPKFHAVDWSRGKPEIADAFRQTLPLPAGADSGFYAELLTHIDVSNNQGLMLLAAIMNDVIVAAGREERPATPLESFRIGCGINGHMRYKMQNHRTYRIRESDLSGNITIQ